MISMEPESTIVLDSDEDTLNTTLKTFASIKHSLEGCWDYKGPAIHTTVIPLWNGLVDLKHRGIRMRCITEITPDNIPYCKKIMEVAELRHMDGIKVNFGIADGKECLLHGTVQNEQSLSQAIVTNAKGIVQAHQKLFESIWNKAMPSSARIKQIESLPKEFSKDTVQKDEIQKISFDLVNSAEQEILLILSNNRNPKNTFWLFDQDNCHTNKFGQLLEKSLERGVNIRILLPYSNNQTKEDDVIKQKLESAGYGGNISVKYLTPSLQSQTTTTTLVTDRKLCLTIVTNKDNAEEIKTATYTNSEYTIWSYISVFEILWVKTNIIKI